MKIGLIGAGLQGKRRAKALEHFGDAQLVIVADADQDRANLLAKKVGCDATTEWEKAVARSDVEIVIVCTPPNLHTTISVEALRSGKHVLCEKPLARTIDEAQWIIDTARVNRVKLKCGLNLRHHSGVQQAKKWLDQNDIGEPIFLRLRYGIGGRPGYEREWRATREISGGGQLMDQGIHAIDLSRWFLGDFTEVFGVLQTGFWDISPLEDNAFVLLRNLKGQVASIHVSWTQWKNLFCLEIFGKEGYTMIEGLGGSYGVEKAILGQRAFLQPFKEESIEFRGDDRSWELEWQEFITAIKENREPLGNAADGLEALKIANAIYESIRTGCMVKI